MFDSIISLPDRICGVCQATLIICHAHHFGPLLGDCSNPLGISKRACETLRIARARTSRRFCLRRAFVERSSMKLAESQQMPCTATAKTASVCTELPSNGQPCFRKKTSTSRLAMTHSSSITPPPTNRSTSCRAKLAAISAIRPLQTKDVT